MKASAVGEEGRAVQRRSRGLDMVEVCKGRFVAESDSVFGVHRCATDRLSAPSLLPVR